MSAKKEIRLLVARMRSDNLSQVLMPDLQAAPQTIQAYLSSHATKTERFELMSKPGEPTKVKRVIDLSRAGMDKTEFMSEILSMKDGEYSRFSQRELAITLHRARAVAAGASADGKTAPMYIAKVFLKHLHIVCVHLGQEYEAMPEKAQFKPDENESDETPVID